MKQQNRAAAAIILAGVLWGIISLFVRELSAAGFDPLQIAFLRLTTASLFLGGYLAAADRSALRFRFCDIWMFVGTGIISVVLFNCCYFYAMIHGEPSIAVVLLYTSPVFVMLMSAVVFREKITGRKIAALVLTIAGCVMVSGVIGSGGKISALVFIVGIGSGFFYGLYSIFGKLALAKYGSMTVTVYTFIFGMLGSLAFSRPSEIVRNFSAHPKALLFCLGIGIVSTLLPYCLYTWGLKYADTGKAAIFAAVEPLVGAVLGMTVLGDSRDPVKIGGISFILLAMVILELKKREKINGKRKKKLKEEAFPDSWALSWRLPEVLWDWEIYGVSHIWRLRTAEEFSSSCT